MYTHYHIRGHAHTYTMHVTLQVNGQEYIRTDGSTAGLTMPQSESSMNFSPATMLSALFLGLFIAVLFNTGGRRNQNNSERDDQEAVR